MNQDEKERRIFELQLEKVKLQHKFAKDGFLMIFFMLFVGGLFVSTRLSYLPMMMVVLIGLFVAILALVAIPRVLSHELDKLMPKE